MKIEDAKSIVRLVKESKAHDLVIVSLIILPIIFGSWNFLINKLFSPGKEANIWINMILIFLYITGLILMKIIDSKDAKDERAKDLIVNHLSKFKQRSYQFISEKYGKEFTEEYLDSLIKKYPNELQHQGIKGKGKGVAIVIEETG